MPEMKVAPRIVKTVYPTRADFHVKCNDRKSGPRIPCAGKNPKTCARINILLKDLCELWFSKEVFTFGNVALSRFTGVMGFSILLVLSNGSIFMVVGE
ncbi:hypothetical protein MTP99_010534 [Tenebrio molitor]|nr:hypothetical protein MTP99_010534 [Tenebrio molitor]